MPTLCSAYGCSNHSLKGECKRRGISFHLFPHSKPDLMRQWLTKIKRENFKPARTSRICSEHFEEHCFRYQNFTNRRLLKKDAVPTKFKFNVPDKGSRRRTYGKNGQLYQSTRFLQNGAPRKLRPIAIRKDNSESDSSNYLSFNRSIEKDTDRTSSLSIQGKEDPAGFSTCPSSSQCNLQSCSAVGCTNDSTNPQCFVKKISFHHFPLDNPNAMQLWLKNMKCTNFIPSKHSTICSSHFTEDCFKHEVATKKRLRSDAVPTIFLHVPQKRNQKRTSNTVSFAEGGTANDIEAQPSEREELHCSYFRRLGSKSVSESEIDETPAASVYLRKDANAVRNIQAVAAKPKKKPKASAKVLDESLFWDFIEGVTVKDDGKFEKKVSVGCATIAANWNTLENGNSSDLDNEVCSENSVKYSVQVNAPGGSGFVNWENCVKICELDCTKIRSPPVIKKHLNLALNLVDQLKMCIKRLKTENVKLQCEKENPLIRNLHNIKHDATEGELKAIIILNQVASYSAQSP